MSDPAASHLRAEHLRRAGIASALLWAAALLVYYYRRPVPPFEATVLHVLLDVFKQLGLGFQFGGAAFPFLPLIGGVIAFALFYALGRSFLNCFDVYMPRRAERGVVFLCGLSIAGLILEPLAIFGWLNTPAVWATLLVSGAILSRIARRRMRRPFAASSGAQDAVVYRRAMRAEARSRYQNSLLRPRGAAGRLFFAAGWLAIAWITVLTFWHAVLSPPSYWDSLILYLGYARATFLEQAFPVKVVAQVGIGLGANYPHLYSLLGSSTAALWAHWSPVYQQFLAPVLGLATTLLVYHTVLRLTRHVNIALCAALLFRAAPYGIAYNCWTSDYALVMALAAGAAYLGLLYIETGLGGYLAALTLLTAAAPHVNYLGWLYWGFWGLVVICAHVPAGAEPFQPPARFPDEPHEPVMREEPEFTERLPRAPGSAALKSRALWSALILGVALSSTWYVRNWIVAGNPVYSFFPGIFRASKNINPEVLESAYQEWRSNGDGIGVIARQMYGANTFPLRLRATWFYFVQWADFPSLWKMGPMLMAFFGPGIAFWLAAFVRRTVVGNHQMASGAGIPRRVRRFDDPTKFGLAIFGLWLAHIAYFYLLGDFYLYQIIAILPLSALFIAWWPLGASGRGFKALFGALALSVAIVPGLPMALMGPKLPQNLEGLRRPLMAEREFYRKAVGPAYDVFTHINQNLKGERLLTHENRHLLFDPSIELVHLDDWDIQSLYDVASPRERAERLKALGIHYYLRVPMEDKHPVNRRLGLDELIRDGLVEIVSAAHDPRGEGAALYRLK